MLKSYLSSESSVFLRSFDVIKCDKVFETIGYIYKYYFLSMFFFIILRIYDHSPNEKKSVGTTVVGTRGTSILGEVRNVEKRVTQQLLCSKSHDFLAVFALAHSKINKIA